MSVFLLVRATKSYRQRLLIAGKIMEIRVRYAFLAVGPNKAQMDEQVDGQATDRWTDKPMPERAWSIVRGV
jgi:hypothetical protein